MNALHEYDKKTGEKVVGVDEAGRGPLAGPVVVCACYIPSDVVYEGIKDSKQFNGKAGVRKRRELYEQLIHDPNVLFEVHIMNHREVDIRNILGATMYGMRQVVFQIGCTFARKNWTMSAVLIDGDQIPHELQNRPYVHSLVKGDQTSRAVAAASIIAKTVHDDLMIEYSKLFPEYKFDEHMGYPTEQHRQLLQQYGPCAIHRTTFKTVRVLLDAADKEKAEQISRAEKAMHDK